jgi:hypothetical protein
MMYATVTGVRKQMSDIINSDIDIVWPGSINDHVKNMRIA